MFIKLPDSVKLQVLTYLEAEDFKSAKELYKKSLLEMNNNDYEQEQEEITSYLH